MTVLVTGAAGLIGFHLSTRLLMRGTSVLGFDNINSYYDLSLKRARIAELQATAERTGTNFQLIEANLEDRQAVEAAFEIHKPKKVVNLRLRRGSLFDRESRSLYSEQYGGFGHILEGCRHHNIEHLVYASSSSVYGGNTNLPFSEKQGVDHPVSLYAASKKANELMAPPIVIFTHCLPLDFVFSLFMVLGEGQIWPCFSLLKRYWLESLLKFSITERWFGISPILMT